MVKKSVKVMLFGLGIILAGIIGAIFNVQQGTGAFASFICFICPMISMFGGPIIMLIGLFMKD